MDYTKVRDTLVLAPEPFHNSKIRTILESQEHYPFVCATLEECEKILQTDVDLCIVVIAIEPASELLKQLVAVQDMFRIRRQGVLPQFIAVPFSIKEKEQGAFDVVVSQLAHVAFGMPYGWAELVRKINVVDHLLQIQKGSLLVDIEHTCTVPPERGCLRGAEVSRIRICKHLPHPYFVKAGFIPLLLGDYLFRRTSESHPKRIATILGELASSRFHSYWLDGENLTNRWFTTNLYRLRMAFEQHCIDTHTATTADAILVSETYVGKATVYYSRANVRLLHPKNGRQTAAA